MLKKLLIPLLCCCTLLTGAPSGWGASLSISSPGGNGVYVIQGAGFEEVSGVSLSIAYLPGTLANPRVEMGSMVRGMVSAVNVGNPGKLAVVSAGSSIWGDGTIATITFDRTGSAAGGIVALNGDLRDLMGRKVPLAQTLVVDVTEQPSQPQPIEQHPEAGGVPVEQPQDHRGTAVPEQPHILGTVTMPPAEAPPPAENSGAQGYDAPSAPMGEPEAETPAEPPAPAAQVPAEEPQPAAQEGEPESAAAAPPATSVLERFRSYRGDRTVHNLVSLFNLPPTASYTQYPQVAIADGTATVTMVIQKLGNATPRFTFDSARFVSLAKVEEGGWEIAVRPDKDAVSASLRVLVHGKWQELPLTVAPQVELLSGKPGEVSEAAFQFFLKERGTEGVPLFDLNGDGRRDYVDDYIYAANYLVKLEEERLQKEQQQQKKR